MKRIIALVLFAAGPIIAGGTLKQAIALGKGCKNMGDLWRREFQKTNHAKMSGKGPGTKTFSIETPFVVAAMLSCRASMQLREFTEDEARSAWPADRVVILLNVGGFGAFTSERVQREYGARAHLAIQSGDQIIQPIEKSMDRDVSLIGSGLLESGSQDLRFMFNIPSGLRNVTFILVSGEGDRSTAHIDFEKVR